MINRRIRGGLAAAVVAAGVFASTAGIAAATSTGSTGANGASATASNKFQHQKALLESQVATRSMRLANLVSDVTNAKSLSSAHASLLSTRLTSEQANISALAATVPNDTTYAELNADRASMLKDNRVFAVMSPQVFETINGDAVLASDTTLQGQQSTLLNEVNSLIGQPGYKNALSHYDNFVSRLTGVATNVARVEINELAQIPEGYPANSHIFVNTNKAVLNATISVAYASYDTSVIGLATGGYTGA